MGRAPGKGGGGGGAPAGVRPRVPALVKREVAESREEDEDAAEDTTRMQYRGFDKSKLNASRKQQRKEARMGKKQHKAAHQRERSAANDKLKKLEEENQRLKRMLEQKAGPPGGAEKKRKADAEPERPAKKPKAAEAPAKKAKNKDVGSKAPKGARTDDSNFMKMIREQGLDKAASAAKSKGKGGSGGSGGGGSKSELQAALEEDLREIEELKSKLGGKWRDELAQDGWLDLFDSMDNLGQDSGEEDPFEDSDVEGDAGRLRVGDKAGKKTAGQDGARKAGASKSSSKTERSAGKGVRFVEGPGDSEGEEDEDEEAMSAESSDEGGDDAAAESGDDGTESVDDNEEEEEEDEEEECTELEREAESGVDSMEEDEEDEEEGEEEGEDEDEEEEDEDEGDESAVEEETEEDKGNATRRGSSAAANGLGGAEVKQEVLQKYVPPHLRAQIEGAQSVDAKLQAAVRNRLNKVSEGNIASITAEMEKLYASNPRSSVDHQLAEMVLELSGEGAGRIIGQFAALYAALVAALHGSVGPAVGARFLERVVRELDELVKQDEPGPRGINLSLIFAHMYIFKVVACSLLYDFVRLLTERFSDGSLDMMLALLRASGPTLRSDDPSSLRDIIQLVRTRATREGASDSLSARGRVVLDFIYDLQNNRIKKGTGATGIAAVAAEEAQRLAKWVRGHSKSLQGAGQSLQMLRPNWKDLAVIERRGGRMGAGQWWEQGVKLEPIRMNRSGNKSLSGGTQEEEAAGGEHEKQLRQLAGSHKMGSEVRKAIFMVMMDSEDYQDAAEKLLRLNLQESQAREIIRVAFHCCCHEQGWNPFYAYLISHLCSIDKHHQFTLRLCFWDAFKEMGAWAATEAGKMKIANVAQLLAHAWASAALSLSLLKPIEIEQMGEGGHLCLKLAFRALLLQCGQHTQAKILSKISAAESEMADLRAGLKWFFFKHMKAQKVVSHSGFGGGTDLPSGQVAKESSDKKVLLQQRVQTFVGLLSKCAS